MYMQIRKFKLKSDDAETVCKQAAEDFLPIVKQLKGFVDYAIVDNRDGHVMSVTVFQDKSGIDESKRQAIEWHKKHSNKFLEGPVEVIEGEVLVDSSGFLRKAGKAA